MECQQKCFRFYKSVNMTSLLKRKRKVEPDKILLNKTALNLV